MPMKISVGLAQKVGLPDYGSLGASCHVELEVEQALLTNVEAFRQRVDEAFGACRGAVAAELAGHRALATAGDFNHAASSPPAAAMPANGNVNGNGNGSSNGHAASEKQMAYLRQLAKQVEGLGLRRLETLGQKMFGKPLAAISSFEASSLIDTIKSLKAGRIDLEAVLAGEGA